jgi:hypothetical protein
MSISPFFHQLRSAYQAEINDLTFDSEGQDVLSRRLTERRKELGFLLQMIELSPEMVAVIFHNGFEFKKPGVMDQLLSQESGDFPAWSSLADAIHQPPWSRDLSRLVLKEPKGEWFLTVAAGLEYMYNKPDGLAGAQDDGDEDEDVDGQSDKTGDDMGDGRVDGSDAAEEADARSREEAGADWMAEQGFDRKE